MTVFGFIRYRSILWSNY